MNQLEVYLSWASTSLNQGIPNAFLADAILGCTVSMHPVILEPPVTAGSILSYSAAILVPWDNDAVSPSEDWWSENIGKTLLKKTLKTMICSIPPCVRWCPSMSYTMQWLAQLVPGHKNWIHIWIYLDVTRGRAPSDARWEAHEQMASFGSMGIFGIRAGPESPAKSLSDPLGPWIPWAEPSRLDEPVDLAECAGSWRHQLDRCSRLLSLSACPILPLGGLFSATAAELEPCRSWFDETCQPKDPLPDLDGIPTSAPTCAGLWSHLWFKRFEGFKLLVCKHPWCFALLIEAT